MRVHRDLNYLPDWKNAVITIGSYDGVHQGHRAILAQMQAHAKQIQGETVLITFEPHPRLVLGDQEKRSAFQLLNALEEKILLLAATGLDHLVVVPFDHAFARLTAEEYLRDFLFAKFRPHTIFIGYDHRFGSDRSGDLETLTRFAEGEKTIHGQPVQIREIQAHTIDEMAVSSTKVRKAVTDGDMDLARRLLSVPYMLQGEVVKGDQLGRTIGYPTANLRLPSPHKLLPPHGVYACRVWVGAYAYVGMLYLGQRPSVHKGTELRVEVNLLDFEGDLYGKTLILHVLQRIRADMVLSGLDALREQIDIDKAQILDYFRNLT